MRFMVMVRATADSESGRLPTREEFERMGEFNEQLIKAGIMLAGEGLQPSSKGARIRFDEGRATVIDGPFAETKELIAGYWLVQVKSKEEAVEWFSRAPMQPGWTLELRQVYEVEDFGDNVTPEMIAREEQLRSRA
ncbi:MAG: YciI family protein [Candidatus Eremiobacteraeota bacterium]|nr:YciI family protein [Candidatus Eremiobacteraeota bacterium]